MSKHRSGEMKKDMDLTHLTPEQSRDLAHRALFLIAHDFALCILGKMPMPMPFSVTTPVEKATIEIMRRALMGAAKEDPAKWTHGNMTLCADGTIREHGPGGGR